MNNPKPKSIRAIAKETAMLCDDAYSYDNYRSWEGVALAILRMGFDSLQAQAIMRSKWTRWAGDCSGKPYGRNTGTDITKFLSTMRNLRKEVEDLTEETFGYRSQKEYISANPAIEPVCQCCGAPLHK
jgi:hypothetical protein